MATPTPPAAAKAPAAKAAPKVTDKEAVPGNTSTTPKPAVDPLKAKTTSDHQAAQLKDVAAAQPKTVAQEQAQETKAPAKPDEKPDQAVIDQKAVDVSTSDDLSQQVAELDPSRVLERMTEHAALDMTADLPADPDELATVTRNLQKLALVQGEEIARTHGELTQKGAELAKMGSMRAQIEQTSKKMESRTKRVMGHDLTDEFMGEDGHIHQIFRVFTPLGELGRRANSVKTGTLATVEQSWNSDGEVVGWKILASETISVSNCSINQMNKNFYDLIGASV